MSRPLLNKTTQELGQLFADCGNARQALKQIADELTHRRVPSARALRRKVEAALAALGARGPGFEDWLDKYVPKGGPANLHPEQPPPGAPCARAGGGHGLEGKIDNR